MDNMFEDFNQFEFLNNEQPKKKVSIIDNIKKVYNKVGTILLDIKREFFHLRYKTKKFLSKVSGVCYGIVIAYLVIQAFVFTLLTILSICGINTTWYSTISSYLPVPLRLVENGWHVALEIALWITLLKGLSTLRNIQEYGGWKSKLLFPIILGYFLYSMFNYTTFIQTATFTLIGCFIMNWFIYIGPWSGSTSTTEVSETCRRESNSGYSNTTSTKMRGGSGESSNIPVRKERIIESAVQRGSAANVIVGIYENGVKKGTQTFNATGELMSFSGNNVVTREGSFIWTYNSEGQRISTRSVK